MSWWHAWQMARSRQDHLPALAPFLSRAGLHKVLQHIAAGTISPEVIVGLAPFLDKETLVEMIRGGLSPSSG